MNFLGDRIEKAMKRKCLSQYRLAKLTGISQSHLSDVINHKSEPGINKLKQLSNFLDVQLLWLITGETVEEAFYRLQPYGYETQDVKTLLLREAAPKYLPASKVPELYQKLSRLNPKHLKAIEDMITMLLENQENKSG